MVDSNENVPSLYLLKEIYKSVSSFVFIFCHFLCLDTFIFVVRLLWYHHVELNATISNLRQEEDQHIECETVKNRINEVLHFCF